MLWPTAKNSPGLTEANHIGCRTGQNGDKLHRVLFQFPFRNENYTDLFSHVNFAEDFQPQDTTV